MGNNNAHNIIAIQDDDPHAAGCIVWWRLSGGLNLPDLYAAWTEAGLDEKFLPDRPSPGVALRRAVASVKGGARRMVRTHPKGGFAIVDERTEDGELAYRQDMHATLDKVGRLVIQPWGHRDEEAVTSGFRSFQDELVQADVSPWLCDLMDRYVDAVRLRDTGGVYFIPQHAMAKWKHIAEVIRKATKHTINAVPAMRTQDAVAAIEDAIASEAERAVESIAAELAEKKLGSKALNNRITTTEDVERKLERYEAFLGGRLEALHTKLQELRASITVAITTVELEAEAAAAQ